MISDRLRYIESCGLISREVLNMYPVGVDYVLDAVEHGAEP